MKREFPYILGLVFLLYSCNQNTDNKGINEDFSLASFKKYTLPSIRNNQYANFNSPNAINKIAEIENEYFSAYKYNTSKYYGTQWHQSIGQEILPSDSITIYERYTQENKGLGLDSMHCTMYATKALEAGFGNEFKQIDQHHKNIWADRENAGWSLGYILTEYYDWQAYLFISKYSKEYEICINNFKIDKKYHVWKQPNIPIEKIFDVDEDQEKINQILGDNEFGWGFSYQGWHTWVTRFEYLKECNWLGAPAAKYDLEHNNPLFLETKFL